MNILFLTKYPVQGASSRYRVYQYLSFVEDAGFSYRVSSFMSERTFSMSSSRNYLFKKLIFLFIDVVRRCSYVLTFFRYDVIYMQRELMPFGPLLMERLFRFFGKVLIFDYDDALFIFKRNESSRLASILKRPARVPDIMRLSHSVFAGNDWLTEQASEFCPTARTFYVAEDLKRYSVKNIYQTDKVVLGWLGSPSTEKYLNIISLVLEDLGRLYSNLELHVIGGGKFSANGIKVKHIEWSYETEVGSLHQFDIGLMPLPSEDWSKGKSGGKARTYMAVGIPAVCQRIGFNCELIQHEENGLLAETLEEWKACLIKLIENGDYRRKIGQAARLEVERRFDLEVIGPSFPQEIYEVYKREKLGE